MNSYEVGVNDSLSSVTQADSGPGRAAAATVRSDADQTETVLSVQPSVLWSDS